jgi:hypothetical protein
MTAGRVYCLQYLKREEYKDEISGINFPNDFGRKMLSFFGKRFLAVQKYRAAGNS